METRGSRLLAMLGCAWLALFALAATAQDGRAVKVIVPTLPGASTDAVGRIVAQQMAKDIGQPVIVENRAGAGGAIGTQLVAQAKPDGQTLLFTMAGPITAVPHVNPSMRYQPKDFKPVAVMFRAPFMVVTGANSPYKSMADLIASGKQSKAPAYGSSGVGSVSHIVGEILNKAASTTFVHIPYSGSADTLRSLISGDIAWALITTDGAKAQIEGGKIRALGVMAKSRTPLYPEVPSMNELGFKNLEFDIWYGLYAPAGISPSAFNQIAASARKVVADPAFVARIKEMGAEVPTGPNNSESIMADLINESNQFQSILKTIPVKNE